ncbi:LacI family DNA-binding transcriptional regulator [Streptomyces sp. NPDC096310]|uniref:LacI family DNA-binding transcriptional regulator n=1 Tax=Streptomyces sp. NPDC096310 TaxID=3366082 RepID=UPI00380488B8
MKDVAARAGVAVGTASRELSGSSQTSPDSRSRVLAAAAELGYIANGPARSLGIGSCATVTAALGGTTTDVTIEVVETDPPRRIAERNVSAAGRRLAHGTYTIEPLRTGGSHVSFTYAWARVPLADRLLAPVVRAATRRANRTVMQRLATELARHASP